MKSMTRFEAFVIPFTVIIAAIGYAASWILDDTAFTNHWISREDGLLETGTFVALFAGAVLCGYRAWKLRHERSRRFTAMLVASALVLFFGAGEEISWGQRLFGIESPEFFQANNGQKETNVHNLVVAGVGINKLVFGKLLAIALVCYLIPLPLLYRRSAGFAAMVDRFAIPVPRLYHAVAILAIVAVVETSPAHKRGEINEYALSSIVFLILLNPTNRKVFASRPRIEQESDDAQGESSTLRIDHGPHESWPARRVA